MMPSLSVQMLSTYCGMVLMTLSVSRGYIMVNETKNWADANTYCEETYGTTLATMKNDNDAALVLQAKYDYGRSIWVGLNDLNVEGTWEWASGFQCDGDCINLDWWIPGRPNIAVQDCAHMWYSASGDTIASLLDDAYCSDNKIFLCDECVTDGEPDDTFDVSLLDPFVNTSVDIDYYHTNQSGQYLFENITCDTVHRDCVIECSVVSSCLLSAMYIDGQSESKRDVIISCTEQVACLGSSVIASNLGDNTDITIICDAQNACQGMAVDVDASNFNSFTVYCSEYLACSDMEINIGHNSNEPVDLNATATIHCVVENACRDIRIVSDLNTTTLMMWEWSDNVVFDNGYGFDEHIWCNDEQSIVYRFWMNETADTIQESILNKYQSDHFPCDGIQVLCGTASCSVHYDLNPQDWQWLSDTVTNASCYYVDVGDLQSVDCIGQCASSPTTPPTSSPTPVPSVPTHSPTGDPTNDPTSNPTIDPSTSPTQEPTLNPTVDPTSGPTDDPSVDPTVSPSSDPTTTPTVDPTTNPTYGPSTDPTSVPTTEPTTGPTVDPTVSPTMDPTRNPTVDPTMIPTTDPTVDPTTDPTVDPTSEPTVDPTADPTFDPTSEPTVDPTPAPSFSPSLSPTQYPTDSAGFDAYVELSYSLSYLTTDNKLTIWQNIDSSVASMVEILERGYVERSSAQLEYREFDLRIDTINGVDVSSQINTDANDGGSKELYDALDVSNVWNTPITVDVTIDIEKTTASLIPSNSDDVFAVDITSKFAEFFNNSDVSFAIETDEAEMAVIEISSDEQESSNLAVISTVVILSSGAAISGAALLWNVLPTKSDQSNWMAPFLLSIHLYDFVSDIILSMTISAEAVERDLSINSLYTWLAAASVATIVMPLFLNSAYATKIQQQESIRNNANARVWFGSHFAIFVVLSLFCSGTFPVLKLVSSGIFGQSVFESGLLSSELRELSKIKIRCTIYLENFPQILIQLIFLYVDRFESENQIEILLALTASMLSIVSTLLIYWGERDLRSQYVVSTYFVGLRMRTAGPMPKDEKTSMNNKKGMRKALGRELAAALGIAEKQMEIGNVTKQERGVMIHIQHLVFANELDQHRQRLNQFNVTPEQYMHSVFWSKIAKISDAVCSHFEINKLRQRDYTVSYQRELNDQQSMTNVLSQTDDLEDGNVPSMRKGTVSYSLGNSKRVAGTSSLFATPARQSIVHRQSSVRESGNVELEMVLKNRTSGAPCSTIEPTEGSGDADFLNAILAQQSTMQQMQQQMQQQLMDLTAMMTQQSNVNGMNEE